MIKFKKHINVKLAVCILALVFFTQNTEYARGMPGRDSLRKPLMFSVDVRGTQEMTIYSIIIQEPLNRLSVALEAGRFQEAEKIGTEILQTIQGDFHSIVQFLQTLEKGLNSAASNGMAGAEAVVGTLRRYAVEDAVAYANATHLDRGPADSLYTVSLGAASWEVAKDRNSLQPKYFRIGPVMFIDKSWMVPSEVASYLQKEVVLRVDWTNGYEEHTVPVIAAILGQDCKDLIVEDDGVGNGTLGLLALQRGAQRVVCIDNDREQIETAMEAFTVVAGGRGVKRLRKSEWQRYTAKPEDKVILIHDDLLNWFRADLETRKRVAGGNIALRIAHTGPVYSKLHPSLIKDVLADPFRPRVILGGHVDTIEESNPLSSKRDEDILTKNNWAVTRAAHRLGNRDFVALVAMPPVQSLNAAGDTIRDSLEASRNL